MGLLGDGNHGSVVDATAFMDSPVSERIGQVVAMGLLVAIGTTRDRGALSIQVTHNGEWDREYFRRPDEATDWLDRILAAAEAQGLSTNGHEAPLTLKPRSRRQRPT